MVKRGQLILEEPVAVVQSKLLYHMVTESSQLSDDTDVTVVEDFTATICGELSGRVTTVRMYKGPQAEEVRIKH